MNKKLVTLRFKKRHFNSKFDDKEFLNKRLESFFSTWSCDFEIVNSSVGSHLVTSKMNDTQLALFRKLMEDHEAFEDNHDTVISEVRDKYELIDSITYDKKVHFSKSEILKVFYIHGWGGGPQSFGKLPSYIDEINQTRSFIYSYPTGFMKYSSPIYDILADFQDFIEVANDDPRGPFAIVAHSMGGIITRAMLSNLRWDVGQHKNYLAAVAFIASPQGGTWLANVAKYLSHIEGAMAQAKSMSHGDEFFERMTKEWSLWYDHKCPCKAHIRSFYAPKDNIASKVSAFGSDGKAMPILNATHTDIIKPSSKEEAIVHKLSQLLREAQRAT